MKRSNRLEVRIRVSLALISLLIPGGEFLIGPNIAFFFQTSFSVSSFSRYDISR
jgi:hypothetical protein